MNNGKRTLWIDLDDTLSGVLLDGEVVQGHRAYFDCIDRFVRYMEILGFDGALVRQTQQEIDMAAAKVVGFGDKTRFAKSMVETYERLCDNRRGWGSIHDDIYAIGMSVFTDYPYVPLDGVPEVLTVLAPAYNLVVVTKGELVEQTKKLNDTGLASMVDQIIVMEHKSKAEWVEKVFLPLGFPTKESLATTVAIGNSVKSDVNPPVELGANGIVLIDSDNWEFEKEGPTPPLPGRKVLSIWHMRDLPAVLNSL